MKTENEILGGSSPSAVATVPPQYAKLDEVQQALGALRDTDYAKLILIAKSWCNQRKLARSVCEPKELLNQAVLKTLECEEGKQWNKQVTMVRHLDRAMQNISGHLVRERMKIVSFPDGLTPDEGGGQHSTTDDANKEKAVVLMKEIFGEDVRAMDIFVLRGQGYRPAEIQKRLGIDATEYTTTNRRILRKISTHLTTKEK
jgi:hypothetical protein